jgi:hypothetical protein
VNHETGGFVINDIMPGAYTAKLTVVEQELLPDAGQGPVFKPMAFEVPAEGKNDLLLLAELENDS